MSTLTDVLNSMAAALTADSGIETLCSVTWGQSLYVVRRSDQAFRPDASILPLVLFRSISRQRDNVDGHYVLQPVQVGVFASMGTEPGLADNIYFFTSEAEAEELAWRVERVLTQTLMDAGIPPDQDEVGETVDHTHLVSAWQYNILIRNIL